MPHRLVVSYIVDLPVGRGKHFLANPGPVLNAAVSGWNAAGINSFQSGYPLAILTAPTALSGAFGGGQPRPNVIRGCNQKTNINYVAAAQQGKSVINASCFYNPPDAGIAANFIGNQPRTDGLIRTQGTDNWDFSVGKTTPLHDDVNLVFRAEAFNVTNRVQFGDPGLTLNSSSFGLLTAQANLPRSFQFSLRVNY